MKKDYLMIAVLCIFALSLIANASAYPIINFYIQKNGEVDVIGIGNITIQGIESKNESIYGTTTSLIGRRDSMRVFNFSLNSEADIVVYLPKEAKIEKIEGKNIEISENNNHKIISQSSDKASIYIEYSFNNNLIVWFILIILIVLILSFYFLRARNRKEKIKAEKQTNKRKTDKFRLIKNILNEREKIIIKKLEKYKKEGIKIKQNQLRKIVNIPKASFSRHLQELEKKKLIRRIGDGRNKRVEMIR